MMGLHRWMEHIGPASAHADFSGVPVRVLGLVPTSQSQ